MFNSLKQRVVKGLWVSAKRILHNDRPVVIVVTGSVGKTTTKEAIAYLLSGVTKKAIRSAAGNLNTEYGVPLAIAGLTNIPHSSWQWLATYLKLRLRRTSGTKGGYLVLEFSSDKAGDIAFLARQVPVDVAVFTRFTLAHSGNTVAEVRQEKLDLLLGLKQKGIIVANADDPEQKTLLSKKGAVSYGHGKAKVQISEEKISLEGARAKISSGKNSYNLAVPVIGVHQLQDVLAALATGLALEFNLAKLVPRFKDWQSPPGRMRLIEGRKEITIIDDTYNSSPAAAEAAVETLKTLAGQRRTVAILGNMNELGPNTVSAHLALGQVVAKNKIDYLIAVGPNAKRIIRGAREGGLPDAHLIDFLKPEKLLAHLDALINNKDVILVKASQNGMKLERVVKKLMASPNQAKQLLVRQN